MLFLVIPVVALLYWLSHRTRFAKLAAAIPGPRPYPIVGNALEYGFMSTDILGTTNRLARQYGKVFRIWLGPFELLVGLRGLDDVEMILTNSAYNEKANVYASFIPWLGSGLLISKGEKWRKHRKFLTPAFHFKILENFVNMFNINADVLMEKLKLRVGSDDFDIIPFMQLFTLDSICETAMGTKINAQTCEHSEYAKHIKQVCQAIVTRGLNPWLAPDFVFNMTTIGKLHNESLIFLHNMTNKVIQSRKIELKHTKIKTVESEENIAVGLKERNAFLDLLLQYSEDGANFTDEEIREEVDTFMFEGHDTTSSGLIFTTHLLAHHMEVQNKVYEELKSIFGTSRRPTTYQDLQEMKYLERVIKESQRLFPSVPYVLRITREDVKLKSGYTIPAGASIAILIYDIHHDPDIYPDPELFNPDRFLPEQCAARHPYAYIPFSAGPRNCIGQKFAMAEMKAALSQILRRFQVLPPDRENKLKIADEVILKPTSEVLIKVTNRT